MSVGADEVDFPSFFFFFLGIIAERVEDECARTPSFPSIYIARCSDQRLYPNQRKARVHSQPEGTKKENNEDQHIFGTKSQEIRVTAVFLP